MALDGNRARTKVFSICSMHGTLTSRLHCTTCASRTYHQLSIIVITIKHSDSPILIEHTKLYGTQLFRTKHISLQWRPVA